MESRGLDQALPPRGFSTSIPLDNQTLFVELLEKLRGIEFARTFGSLSGSFGRKTKDGSDHWYFRSSAGGHGRDEFYVGPNNEQTQRLIGEHKRLHIESLDLTDDCNRMAAMLVIGGCAAIDHASARVISALAAGGLFRNGGVLVGTHAYVAMGNMLGVRWEGSSRTQDSDVASFRTLEVAVPPAPTSVWRTLEALNMGFLPTPGLDPKTPSTSFSIRGQKLRVDLLTTASRTGPFTPVFVPGFNAAALPMPFMDYLLEGSLDGIVLSGGATLVKIPDPARFGFHKLMVSQARPPTEEAKAVRDLAQASQLLNHLLVVRPGDVELAYDRLETKGFHKRVAKVVGQRLPQDRAIVAFLDKRFQA
jgi:hypothetical protein